MLLYAEIYIEGLNLEKLLRTAALEGICFRNIQRIDMRRLRTSVPAWQMKRLEKICSRFGWCVRVERSSLLERWCRFLRVRWMLFAGLAVCAALVYGSDRMILDIRIENARESVAEVRTFLDEEGVHRGRLKSAYSLDDLRAKMVLRMPDLAFSGIRYEGSTMIVDCYPAETGEKNVVDGLGRDIIASRDGIVMKIYVQSGTPVVSPGQAVRKGQILIRGEERTQKGQTIPVRAQGHITARVWEKGIARASLKQKQTVETGRMRYRVTVCTPWSRKVVQDAEPFSSQDISVQTQRITGLYLPLWREIETFAETIVHQIPAERTDAMSCAQQAAEQIAKNGCPYNALILDKWVDYSMIDNEFVYATVVLEYEAPIAARSAVDN